MDFSSLNSDIQSIIENNGKNPQPFWEFLTSPKFYLSVIAIAVAVGLWVLLTKLSRHYNQKIKESEYNFKEQGQRRTIAHIMTSVLRVIIIVGAVIAFLQIQGFNVSSLVAGVSIITAIIGFALQDAIKDVICGMYIIADHYFEVGDVISYNDDEGEVTRMSIRTTQIKSLKTGSVITISNRSFSEAKRACDWWDIDLGLSYDEKPARVHIVLKDLCANIEKIEGITKCEYKGTNEFSSSSVLYKIRCYSNPIEKYELRRAALKMIQDRLEKEDIKIPYQYINIVMQNNNN